eukprot:jgi/Botrbrau1/16907/Bobra.0233s0001.1
MEGVDLILGQDWMSLREATVSVGVGKAQIKHQGKWVTLDPHRKVLPCTLQWGMNIVRKGKNKVDQWRLCLLNVVMRPEEYAWDEQESSREENGLDPSDDESGTSSTNSRGPGTQGGPVPELFSEPLVEGEEEGIMEGEEEKPTSSSGVIPGGKRARSLRRRIRHLINQLQGTGYPGRAGPGIILGTPSGGGGRGNNGGGGGEANVVVGIPILAARQLRRNVEPAEPELRSVKPRVAMDSGGRARPSGVTQQLDTSGAAGGPGEPPPPGCDL